LLVAGSDLNSKQVASSPVGQNLASTAAIDRYKLKVEELEKQLSEVGLFW